MDLQDDTLLEIIEKIYAAAADPNQWQAAVDAFCSQYPNGRGTVLHHDVRVGSGSFPITSSTWDPTWVSAYNDYYAKVNPWLKNLKKRPVGLATPAEFMVNRAEFLKTEFFSDFMRPQGLLTGVGVTIHQDKDRFIAVSVIYPERSAQNEQSNVALLQRLAPHFRRALQVNHKLARTKIGGAASEAALDRLAVGFVMVDSAGRLVYQNKAAIGVLTAKDGIGLDKCGNVVMDSTTDNAWLKGAIASAATVLDGKGKSPGAARKVGRRSGKRPYSLLVTPLRLSNVDYGTADCVAAIIITDDDHSHLVPSAVIADVFGITHAEARMLRLLIDGHSISEAGDALGISTLTARTHVKNMFAKMNCSRQSDLIRAVIEHPIWLLGRD